MTTVDPQAFKSNRLGVVRCIGTGALALGGLYLLCWAGAAMGVFAASHMFINLFTAAEPASGAALAIGLCSSLIFGALAGALTALAYNALAFLAPR